MTAAVKKDAGKGGSRKRPPELVPDFPKLDDLPKPDDLAKSPYPEGVRVFSYQPKDDGEPILLAMSGFDQPTKVWLFDLAQQPILAQTWAWMRKANVPTDIQRRCQLLPDVEYFEMFDKWFDAMKGQNAGAVTAGK